MFCNNVAQKKMRIKPTFEELANRTLLKPTIVGSAKNLADFKDDAFTVAQLRGMTNAITRADHAAQITRAQAESIARDQGVSADIVLDILRRQNAGVMPAFRDMAQASADGQDRTHLLNQDNLMGQLQQDFRHQAQLNRVVSQVVSAHPAPQVREALDLAANIPIGGMEVDDLGQSDAEMQQALQTSLQQDVPENEAPQLAQPTPTQQLTLPPDNPAKAAVIAFRMDLKNVLGAAMTGQPQRLRDMRQQFDGIYTQIQHMDGYANLDHDDIAFLGVVTKLFNSSGYEDAFATASVILHNLEMNGADKFLGMIANALHALPVPQGQQTSIGPAPTMAIQDLPITSPAGPVYRLTGLKDLLMIDPSTRRTPLAQLLQRDARTDLGNTQQRVHAEIMKMLTRRSEVTDRAQSRNNKPKETMQDFMSGEKDPAIVLKNQQQAARQQTVENKRGTLTGKSPPQKQPPTKKSTASSSQGILVTIDNPETENSPRLAVVDKPKPNRAPTVLNALSHMESKVILKPNRNKKT